MHSRRDILTLPLATVTYPRQHPLAGQRDPVNAYALRHPAGLILVDTGIGAGNDQIDKHYQPVRRTLEGALAAHGLATDQVTLVINTHLHFDHCGDNHLFAGIPIVVQAAEHAAARRPEFTIAEWVDFPGADYRLLDGEAEVAPGVQLIPTPGHTPGHQAVLIECEDGRVLLAGQAVQSLSDYIHLHETGDLPAAATAPDEPAYRASARRLRALSPHVVHFSHDTDVWQAFDGSRENDR